MSVVQILWMELAEGGEEFVCDGFIEGEPGWKLDEQRAKLFAEAADLSEELMQ